MEESFAGAEASKWAFPEVRYGGAYSFTSMGRKEQLAGEIAKGVAAFKAAPHTYAAMWYQADMVEWPADQQKYTLLHRKGTKGFAPQNTSEQGGFACVQAAYKRLPSLEGLGASTDKFTDSFGYGGYKCGPPIKPGRGEGVGDVPSLKFVGDIDPSDITQGGVGDCWLLSGISSLAEFDGAIARLFRKTEGIERLPQDMPNSYTVSLFDLTTWQEVDVVVDERLARKPDGTGLLGCEPSQDGELWACYLEKAVAAHCGGWDKIDGGQCTHAWALLTGCKSQYTIRREKVSGKYACYGKFNPNDDKWEPHANPNTSPNPSPSPNPNPNPYRHPGGSRTPTRRTTAPVVSGRYLTLTP